MATKKATKRSSFVETSLGVSCNCPGCLEGLEPFTLEHFNLWALPLSLDNGDPWVLEGFQQEIVEDLFAPVDEVWVIIPEANAKTTLLGGFSVYHAEHVPQPWVPIGAASRDQAEIMFLQAAGFIEGDKRMSKRFRVYEGYRKIKCPTGGRGIKVYAYDPKTGDGPIPTLALTDELHRHPDLRLYRLWKGKRGKRGAKLGNRIVKSVTISTAGEPGSEFEEQRERIRLKAKKRERNGCHLRAEGTSLIYHEWMVSKVEDATNLEIVKQANPLEQITLEYLESKLGSETLDYGEDWLRLTCNIPTRSVFAAIPEADWDDCATEERIPPGVPISAGADFAWIQDCTAITPLWFRDPQFRLFGDPEILTPPRDGTMLDVQEVKDAFLRVHERNPIELVVLDKTKAEDVAQWLEDELGCEVMDYPQKNEQAARNYERYMEAISNRWLKHTGHQEFRRHNLNAIAARTQGDKYRFDRPHSSRSNRGRLQERRVIDALTAASMVHGYLSKDEPSVYESRGMVMV